MGIVSHETPSAREKPATSESAEVAGGVSTGAGTPEQQQQGNDDPKDTSLRESVQDGAVGHLSVIGQTVDLANRITATDFLNTIFQQPLPPGESVLVSKGRRTDGAPTFHIRPSHEAFGDISRSRLQWFFAACTTVDSGEERLSHRAADAVAAYCLVLDDIGTKASVPPVAPSWRLETSKNNEQHGYILEPTEDLGAVEGVLCQLAERGLTDKACVNAERFFRLPGAWHVKKGFRARLNEWEPDRVWTIEELAADFGVDPAHWGKSRKLNGNASTVGVHVDTDDALLRKLVALDMVVKDTGDPFIDIICPWADEPSPSARPAMSMNVR